MGFSGIGFGAINVRGGLDADKPTNPRVGQFYVATDTFRLYRCFVAGTWEYEDEIDRLLTKSIDTSSGSLFSDDSDVYLSTDYHTSYQDDTLVTEWTINEDLPITDPVIQYTVTVTSILTHCQVHIYQNDEIIDTAVYTTTGTHQRTLTSIELSKGDSIKVMFAVKQDYGGNEPETWHCKDIVLIGTVVETFTPIEIEAV